MRRLLVAIPVIFGLALALLPLQATGSVADGMALIGSILNIESHQHSHDSSAGNHQHGHSDFEDCHGEAGHCTPSVPGLAVYGHGHIDASVNMSLKVFDEPPRTGFQPQPLIPPPEHV